MYNIGLLRDKLDKIIYELYECVENKKGLNDTLVYGNYQFLMGKYFGIMDIFEYVNMEEWTKRYELDKPQLDKWAEWADKLYRKLTGKDGDI